MTSSADSRTKNFWPVVKATTVSGVTSTCSIRSALTINGTWFSLVSCIINYSNKLACWSIDDAAPNIYAFAWFSACGLPNRGTLAFGQLIAIVTTYHQSWTQNVTR